MKKKNKELADVVVVDQELKRGFLAFFTMSEVIAILASLSPSIGFAVESEKFKNTDSFKSALSAFIKIYDCFDEETKLVIRNYLLDTTGFEIDCISNLNQESNLEGPLH